jgi:predicted nucleic acid-binding protein
LKSIINLALDKNADFLIDDDRKARNEAKELGFKLIKTSTLLRRAEKLRLINSYLNVIIELKRFKIFFANINVENIK